MRYWSVSVVFLVCASACAQVDAPVHDYPEDNAWHNYYRAFDLVPDDDEIANRIDNADGEPSVDDVRRYVAGSKLALDELRRGLGKPCAIVYAEPDDFLAFIHEMSGIPRNAGQASALGSVAASQARRRSGRTAESLGCHRVLPGCRAQWRRDAHAGEHRL